MKLITEIKFRDTTYAVYAQSNYFLAIMSFVCKDGIKDEVIIGRFETERKATNAMKKQLKGAGYNANTCTA